MSKGCARHPDRPAATHCHRCQKAVCKSCLLVTPYGSFCSSECSLSQRALKEQEKAAGRNPRKIWKNMTVIVLLAMMLLFAIHIFFYQEGGLKGLLLRLFERVKEGGP